MTAAQMTLATLSSPSFAVTSIITGSFLLEAPLPKLRALVKVNCAKTTEIR